MLLTRMDSKPQSPQISLISQRRGFEVAPQDTVECVALAEKHLVVQESLPASATHSTTLHAVLWCYRI
jgi:hypothetical protein